MDELVERVADVLMEHVDIPHITATNLARDIIPLVQAHERERCAQVAEIAWVSADYNVVGVADADMAMELCQHAATTIRAGDA